jgi:hypothetical protein
MTTTVDARSFKKQPIRKIINETIFVYNPDVFEPEEKRMDKLMELIKKYTFDNKITVNDKEFIREVLPLTSNVLLDTLSDEEIDEIYANPTYEWLLLNSEITELIEEITNVIYIHNKNLSKLTPDQVLKIFEDDEVKISDEDLAELERLESLAKKAGKR